MKNSTSLTPCPPRPESRSSCIRLKVMYTIMGAFKAAGYRSATQYLDLAMQEHSHIQHGGAWTEQLQLAYRVCSRSCHRGLGPAKQATAWPLDRLVGLSPEPCRVAIANSFGLECTEEYITRLGGTKEWISLSRHLFSGSHDKSLLVKSSQSPDSIPAAHAFV